MTLPLSAVGGTVWIALISLAFIIGGYIAVAGLWYLMVYRPSRSDRAHEEPTEQSDRASFR